MDFRAYFDTMPTASISGAQNAEFVAFSSASLRSAQVGEVQLIPCTEPASMGCGSVHLCSFICVLMHHECLCKILHSLVPLLPPHACNTHVHAQARLDAFLKLVPPEALAQALAQAESQSGDE